MSSRCMNDMGEIYMNEIIQKIRQFNEERDWEQYHSPENLAKSVAIEAGELLECFQWSPDYNSEAVKEELADVMMYLVRGQIWYIQQEQDSLLVLDLQKEIL